MREIIEIAVGSLVSALFTALICLRARPLAARLGLIDRPDGTRKLHSSDTPLMGGVAVLVPALTVSLVYLFFVDSGSFMLPAIAASAIVLMLGLLDDFGGLSVRLRFIVMGAVVLTAFLVEPLFILHSLRLKTVGLDIALGYFAVPVTLVIVVGFVNAANMADGINGQLLGSTIIWSIFLIHYSGMASAPFFAVMASCAVALVFNLRGALFSGSAGSYALPLFIGLSTIAVYRWSNGVLNAEEPALWFWLPVTDCIRLFAWRMKRGRSPFSPDRNHLHHILQDAYGPGRALAIYLLLLAMPGAVAMVSESWGIVAFAICLAAYAFIATGRLRGTTRNAGKGLGSDAITGG